MVPVQLQSLTVWDAWLQAHWEAPLPFYQRIEQYTIAAVKLTDHKIMYNHFMADKI